MYIYSPSVNFTYNELYRKTSSLTLVLLYPFKNYSCLSFKFLEGGLMISFPQELENTGSDVRKIREAMELEKRIREAEAARAKQMQMAFKQASTKILSQVLLQQVKLLNSSSFSIHCTCAN